MEIIEFFSVIGTISFSLQGGLIAMEKKFDLFAVYLFGIINSFGGGALRYMLLGESGNELWVQDVPFIASMVTITAVLIFPHFFLKNRYFWTSS